jgi:hypothetical protein
MKKIFYEKVGKRYKPVKEYDDILMSAFPKGTHVVVCRLGATSYTYNVDPSIAPLLAAGKYAEDIMARTISEEMTKVNLQKTPITKEQQELWQKLAASFKQTDMPLYRNAAIETARAGIKALDAEVEKMLAVPAVKLAYDHFMLVWKLTKENDN